MSYDNTNTGALFKNDKERDTHPDYKGSINIDGTEYWLSSWINTSKQGKKFMSLKASPKEQAPQKETRKPSHDAAKARQLPKHEEFDDELPPF